MASLGGVDDGESAVGQGAAARAVMLYPLVIGASVCLYASHAAYYPIACFRIRQDTVNRQEPSNAAHGSLSVPATRRAQQLAVSRSCELSEHFCEKPIE